jgi:hypothetical protein
MTIQIRFVQSIGLDKETTKNILKTQPEFIGPEIGLPQKPQLERVTGTRIHGSSQIRARNSAQPSHPQLLFQLRPEISANKPETRSISKWESNQTQQAAALFDRPNEGHT